MKAQTYHNNAMGVVVNPSSASGFRLQDDHGNWIDARVIDGTLTIEQGKQPMLRCYQCSREVSWLNHNSRCLSCLTD